MQKDRPATSGLHQESELEWQIREVADSALAAFVVIQAAIKPMDLYTYDVNLDRIPVPAVQPDEYSLAEAAPAPPPNVTFSMKAMENEFTQHPDLMSTWDVTTHFLKRFQQGFELYRSGQWMEARTILEETRTMRKHHSTAEVLLDGPSSTLLAVMEQHKNVAPESWAGFRELTEK